MPEFTVSNPDAEQVRDWLSTQPAAAELQSLRDHYLPDAERSREWATAAAGVCAGKLDPIQLAERWQKPGETLPELLEWWFHWTGDLIKIKTNAKAFLVDPAALCRT